MAGGRRPPSCLNHLTRRDGEFPERLRVFSRENHYSQGEGHGLR